MVKPLLVRGMLVGLCAGLLAFAFASAFGETQIDHAIAFETHRLEQALARVDPGARLAAGPVSRSVQSTFGLALGTTIYGVGFGGIFALVFAGIFGRVGGSDARRTAALLALAGFVVIILVPFLKYPANPPSIGHPETITRRTELYLVMIAISIASAITAVRLHRLTLKRRDAWAAGLVAVGAFVVIAGAAELFLPTVDEVPRAFSATLLWHFRMASLGTQITMWSTIGIGFGLLAERALDPAGARPHTRLRRRRSPART